MKFQFSRIDAAEGLFLSRQLEHIRASTYDIKYAKLKGRMFCPVDNSVSPGAETHTYRQYDMRGLAKIIANYATDLPRADVVAAEFTSKIRGIGASYGYSIQEVRAARFAGQPLEQRKANAARRAVEEKLDSVAQEGDDAHGLLGLLNQPNATDYSIPNGAGGLATWVSKTPDEVIADLHGIVNNTIAVTKEVETPDTILLPIEQYQLISSKRMGDGDSTTILKHFLATSPHVKDVQPWYACNGAGDGGADRMVCYRKDPDALVLIISQEFEQFPPEQRGMEFVTACHLRTGGVVMFYPLSMAYGDGI
jgi:hypothetical protein